MHIQFSCQGQHLMKLHSTRRNGEIWNDTCCIFGNQMRMVSTKRNLKDFCHILESLVSWQAQYLAMLEGDSCCSAGCIWRFSPLPTFLLISWNVIFHGRRNEWWCWRVTEVGLCYVNVGWTILNNFLWYGGMSCFVASAMFGDVQGDSWCFALCQWHFSRLPNTPLIFWNVIFSCQAQCLVMLEGDSCCYPGCKWRFSRLPSLLCHFSWQAKYLVMLESDSACSAQCTCYMILHVLLRLSNMNVVVPLCFASERLLRAMYRTIHVLRLSNGLVQGRTLRYLVILCCTL